MKDTRIKEHYLTQIVIAVQNFKEFGYSETVMSDKGTAFFLNEQKDGYDNEYGARRGKIFEEIIGENFGKKDLILPPNSYRHLIERIDQELRIMLKDQKRKPTEPYDDMREILGEKYVINLRKDKDVEISSFNRFYCNIKEYSDFGYPLYLTIATPEDVKKHFGNFKAGDKYERISNQNK